MRTVIAKIYLLRGEPDTETTPFLWAGQNRVEVTRRAHFIKAILYGVQNFYAFMIM